MVLLTPSEAARVCGVSAQTIRDASDCGELPTFARTQSGTRLFAEIALERYRGDRTARIGQRKATVNAPETGASQHADPTTGRPTMSTHDAGRYRRFHSREWRQRRFRDLTEGEQLVVAYVLIVAASD